tara:strand:+ start:2022 stop:2231 length:210 start_codon:yes stop_codon:yes gene_type:complete
VTNDEQLAIFRGLAARADVLVHECQRKFDVSHVHKRSRIINELASMHDQGDPETDPEFDVKEPGDGKAG